MNDFLNKIKEEGKLELVEPSEEISSSYSIKADNCLKSAKILRDAKLNDNSVSEAYYAMYNSLLSLLFKTGVKCENHTASIALLKKLFGFNELNKILEKAKKERIDRQYYVVEEASEELNEEAVNKMVADAEEVILKLNVYKKQLNEEKTKALRQKFDSFFIKKSDKET